MQPIVTIHEPMSRVHYLSAYTWKASNKFGVALEAITPAHSTLSDPRHLEQFHA